MKITYSEQGKTSTGCAPFGKPVPQISLPLPSQTMEKSIKRKRIMNNVIQNINLCEVVEEKKPALSSTLLSLMFKSRVNFALGNAVKHIGLLRRTLLAWMVIKKRKNWIWEFKFSLLLSLHPAQWSVLFPGLFSSGWDRLISSFGSH